MLFLNYGENWTQNRVVERPADMKLLAKLKEGILDRAWSIRTRLSWHVDAFKIRHALKPGADIQPMPDGKKLILIPHPDDEWIGCSGIVSDISQEVVFVDMDMSGDDSPQRHEARKAELTSVAGLFGRKVVRVSTDKVQSLCDILNQESPRYVALPFFVDWHWEHLAVIAILARALKHSPLPDLSIIMYQISVPILPFAVTHAVPLDKKAQQRKWNVFSQYYPSQSYMPAERFRLCERINGKLVDSFAAEVYSVLSAKAWMDMAPSSIPDETMRNDMVKRLSSIHAMRQYAGVVSKQLGMAPVFDDLRNGQNDGCV